MICGDGNALQDARQVEDMEGREAEQWGQVDFVSLRVMKGHPDVRNARFGEDFSDQLLREGCIHQRTRLEKR